MGNFSHLAEKVLRRQSLSSENNKVSSMANDSIIEEIISYLSKFNKEQKNKALQYMKHLNFYGFEKSDIKAETVFLIENAFNDVNEDYDSINFCSSFRNAICKGEGVRRLAKRMKVSYQRIYSYFKDRRLQSITIMSLCKVLSYYGLVLSVSHEGNQFFSADHKEHLLNLSKIAKEKGGIYSLSRKVDYLGPAISRNLSRKGNPSVKFLFDIIKELNLKVSVKPIKSKP